MKPVLLFLTCANVKEAETIGQRLLEKRLVVCVKKLPVSSASRWKGRIERAEEVLLLLESIAEDFSAIEREVKKLHSFETFVLVSIPVQRASKGVLAWMREELVS